MTHFNKESLYKILLVISYVPLVLQGVFYLWIGEVYPFMIGLFLICTSYYFIAHTSYRTRMIKVWSILLIGYGFIRAALHILMFVESSGVPSGIYYQFDFWFGVRSGLYILLGIYLLSFRRKLVLA